MLPHWGASRVGGSLWLSRECCLECFTAFHLRMLRLCPRSFSWCSWCWLLPASLRSCPRWERRASSLCKSCAKTSLLSGPLSRGCALRLTDLSRLPEVALQVHTKFDDGNTLAFEKFFLQQSVWSADENLSVVADHAVPGNAFSGWSGGHGASGRARSARQTQNSSQPPIR